MKYLGLGHARVRFNGKVFMGHVTRIHRTNFDSSRIQLAELCVSFVRSIVDSHSVPSLPSAPGGVVVVVVVVAVVVVDFFPSRVRAATVPVRRKEAVGSDRIASDRASPVSATSQFARDPIVKRRDRRGVAMMPLMFPMTSSDILLSIWTYRKKPIFRPEAQDNDLGQLRYARVFNSFRFPVLRRSFAL
jgi:hypothetical protein